MIKLIWDKENRIKLAIGVVTILVLVFAGYGFCNASSSKNNSSSDTVSKNAVSDKKIKKAEILKEYRDLQQKNKDLAGWLSIENTHVDYPVMQTLQDEEYYLRRDFYGNDNEEGCLIMDTDSVIGTGTSESHYQNGTKPGTNLIIHGHNMKNGSMFGELELYADQVYGLQHANISFDSLYEHRKYEIISVFYAQVLEKDSTEFKYYDFFEAENQEEFDHYYQNIMELSLYETGVEAEYGDEFLTLSTCSYQEENGRFVVIAKRVE